MEDRVLRGVIASKMEVIIGAIIMLLFLALALTTRVEGPRWVCMGFMFLGASFVARGLEWSKLVNLYRTYEVILSNNPSGSLNALASATKMPLRNVKKALQTMIKRRMTGSMIIDEETNCIVGSFSPKMKFSADIAASKEASVNSTATSPTALPISQETSGNEAIVVCPNCGEKNSMTRNATALCGHCGTKIVSE